MVAINYTNYVDTLKEVMFFESEWDNEDLNISYSYFKDWYNSISDKARLRDNRILMIDFIKEFYQDASEETHSYWINSSFNSVLHRVVQQSEPCKHPRSERQYVGEGYLRCKLCGETFK